MEGKTESGGELEQQSITLILPNIDSETGLFANTQNADTDIEEIQQSAKIRQDIVESRVSEQSRIKVEQGFRTPCYLLDFGESNILSITFKALLDNVKSEGHTAVYIKKNDKCMLVGYRDEMSAFYAYERSLPMILGNKCKVYRNNGDGFKEANINNMSSLRLNL